MKFLHSVKFLLFAGLFASTLFSLVQAKSPVSAIIDAEGVVIAGASGGFDASGYKMDFGPRGEPRFIAENLIPAGGCGDGWDSSFVMNGTNGSVQAVVSDDAGNVYVGGAFQGINSGIANSIAKWDGTNWSALGSGINGRVEAIAVDGGNVYIAGQFTSAGGVPALNVAKWNGTAWSALGPGIGGAGGQFGVLTIAASGNDVYVGGLFNSNGGFPNFVAHWNGTSWVNMGTGMNNTVRSLTVFNNAVYAGGLFTTADGLPANGVAKWDGTSWTALGSGVNGRVNVFAVSGNDLYAAGGFTTAGDVPASSIAKWNGTNWSAVGAGVGNGDVNALKFVGADLYVGGSFTTAGGATANRIAKWNGSGWSTLGSGITGQPVNGTPTVFGFGVNGTTIVAGGRFETAGGQTAFRIAKWSGSAWTAFSGSTVDNVIRSVAVSGTDVYVVGSFTTAGGVIVNNVAKWNGTAWSALGLGVPGGFLNAVAVSGNNVYVAGNFQSAGGTAANNIARWNGSTWQQLGSGIPNGVVFSLAVAGNDVYAGGSFTNAGTTAANRIAKWNGTTWSGLNSAIVNDVTTIVPAGNVIYVGTSTTTVDSPNYFLKYDGTTWTPLGTGMTGGGVSSIALVGSDIYVAGGFTGVGGITTPQIAKFDGTNWSALGAGLPNGGFGGSNVVRLATIGSDLFAVGDFNVATGGPGNRIAKWNGTSWSRLGDGLNNNGLAVAAAGDSVFVGGEFIAAGCNISPFFARWRQTLWTGTINSDWHNPGNWGSGSVPPSNVGVTIDTNSASITSADVALSSLIVKNGRTLNVGPNRTLTVTGNVFLENGNLAGTGNLIVNGDLILNDASIIDFSSVVVNGNLVLNNGSISGPGIVSLTACRPGAMIGGNSVSFIASPFSRCVDSSGVYRFPVGTGLVYSPAELTNITGSGNFTVNARAGAYSNTANGLPANRLLRWWNLTNGGVTRANVTVDYQQADIVGAERQYRAFSIAGGNAVRIPALLNQATNRAVVSGVTSSFALTLAEIDSENVTMTGRLTSNRGRGAEYVVVTLTDSLGVSRITQTNQSGYFRFPNVATFQVYTVTVRSKKFTFTAPQRAVDFDELTGDVNFVSTDH